VSIVSEFRALEPKSYEEGETLIEAAEADEGLGLGDGLGEDEGDGLGEDTGIDPEPESLEEEPESLELPEELEPESLELPEELSELPDGLGVLVIVSSDEAVLVLLSQPTVAKTTTIKPKFTIFVAFILTVYHTQQGYTRSVACDTSQEGLSEALGKQH
jgi:hypothetical protein